MGRRDEAGRALGTRPARHDAAEAVGGELLLVPDPDVEAAALRGLPVALGGIIAAGALYAAIGVVVMLVGCRWIESVMPPVVTGSVVAIIGLNLAPVADVNNNPRNPVINTRSFGESPGQVAPMVSAYVRALQSAGMLATLKHFPGHGDTAVDSHLGLPLIAALSDGFEISGGGGDDRGLADPGAAAHRPGPPGHQDGEPDDHEHQHEQAGGAEGVRPHLGDRGEDRPNLLAQVALDRECKVVDGRTGMRRYVNAGDRKVRTFAMEGEKDIDADNPKTLYFHLAGTPNAITLYLRGARFSTIPYTELGLHTHEYDLTAQADDVDLLDHTHDVDLGNATIADDDSPGSPTTTAAPTTSTTSTAATAPRLSTPSTRAPRARRRSCVRC